MYAVFFSRVCGFALNALFNFCFLFLQEAEILETSKAKKEKITKLEAEVSSREFDFVTVLGSRVLEILMNDVQ